MSEPFTPNQAEVRYAYVDRKFFEDEVAHVEPRGDEEASREFDRWLAAHDAKVWDEGQDSPWATNPYREDR